MLANSLVHMEIEYLVIAAMRGEFHPIRQTINRYCFINVGICVNNFAEFRTNNPAEMIFRVVELEIAGHWLARDDISNMFDLADEDPRERGLGRADGCEGVHFNGRISEESIGAVKSPI